MCFTLSPETLQRIRVLADRLEMTEDNFAAWFFAHEIKKLTKDKEIPAAAWDEVAELTQNSSPSETGDGLKFKITLETERFLQGAAGVISASTERSISHGEVGKRLFLYFWNRFLAEAKEKKLRRSTLARTIHAKKEPPQTA
jgi:hypothetical protein